MMKVVLVKTKTCPYCPSASRLWKGLQKKHDFEYKEIDALSNKGQQLILKHLLMAVPTTIIDNRVAFVGIPDKKKAREILKNID